MDPRLNLARGVLDGINTGLDGLDRIDARKRNQELQQREDLLFEQQQSDNATARARQETIHQRQLKTWDQEDEDRAHTLERREAQDEHQDALMPIQLQAQHLNLATAQTQQRLAKQQIRNQEVTSLWNEASALFDGGEYAKADGVIAKLSDYGYDVEGMTTGGAEFAQTTVEQFIEGNIGYDSPKMVQLANMVLKPSLVQSGRDSNRFSIAGIVPTGRADENGSMTFMVSMHDKEDGQPKPVTLNATNRADDPNSEDPVVEISASDLMAATQQFIGASTASTRTRMMAIGAGLTDKAYQQQVESPKDKAQREKYEAEIKKIEAETARIKGEGGGAAQSADPMKQLFVSTYENQPRLLKVAEMMQQAEGFDFSTGIQAMAELKAMSGEKKYIEYGAGELWETYKRKKTIEREVKSISTEATVSFMERYPNISEKDREYIAGRILKYVDQYKRSVINDTQFNGRMEELHERMNKKPGTAAAPVDSPLGKMQSGAIIGR